MGGLAPAHAADRVRSWSARCRSPACRSSPASSRRKRSSARVEGRAGWPFRSLLLARRVPHRLLHVPCGVPGLLRAAVRGRGARARSRRPAMTVPAAWPSRRSRRVVGGLLGPWLARAARRRRCTCAWADPGCCAGARRLGGLGLVAGRRTSADAIGPAAPATVRRRWTAALRSGRASSALGYRERAPRVLAVCRLGRPLPRRRRPERGRARGRSRRRPACAASRPARRRTTCSAWRSGALVLSRPGGLAMSHRPLASIITWPPLAAALLIIVPARTRPLVRWVVAGRRRRRPRWRSRSGCAGLRPRGGRLPVRARRSRWCRSLGISYPLAVDGMSLADRAADRRSSSSPACSRRGRCKRAARSSTRSCSLLVTGVYGVFVSLDLFVFFLFYEIAVLPMYLLIGIWGSSGRGAAAGASSAGRCGGPASAPRNTRR